MMDVLVVEDEIKLNQSVCIYLNNNGYHAVGCLNAQEAYQELYNQNFDLILSDIMMPKIDGFEFAKTVRETNPWIPILFLTARDDFTSKQKGFQAGIDDYMIKPVDLQELLLRISALCRRARIHCEKQLQVGNLQMNMEAMTVTLNQQEVPFTTREFRLLYKLLSYPNKTFSRSQLMDEFWGLDTDTSLRAVDVYITKLRDKLSECDGFDIVTIRTIGYKAVLHRETK